MRIQASLFTLCAALSACGDDATRASPIGNATDASVDVGPSVRGDTGLLADASDAGCTTCVGASMPSWQLTDYQPESPGFGKTYGLEAFRGKVTVVALLASW
jgi:hypothetical protein